MNAQERDALRALVDARRRVVAEVVADPGEIDLTQRRSRTGPAPSGKHGTVNGYSRGCRCRLCKDVSNTARQARRKVGNVLTHNVNGYSNGCRCDVCHSDMLRDHRERYHARKAAA